MRAARDGVAHARQTVVLCVGEGVTVRDGVRGAVVGDLGEGGVGVVDLLLVHGAVLAVGLAVAGDYVGAGHGGLVMVWMDGEGRGDLLEEPAGRVGVGVCLGAAGGGAASAVEGEAVVPVLGAD